MKRITTFAFLLLVLLAIVGCELDGGAPIPGTDDSIAAPDTIVPDYRVPFTGLFDISAESYEYGQASTWEYFTDSVTMSYTSSLEIPFQPGSRKTVLIDSAGTISHDYMHSGIYILADGAYSGHDAFSVHIHMDVQPHTFGYHVTGTRH